MTKPILYLNFEEELEWMKKLLQQETDYVVIVNLLFSRYMNLKQYYNIIDFYDYLYYPTMYKLYKHKSSTFLNSIKEIEDLIIYVEKSIKLLAFV